jgi:hypothetical protein
MIRPDALECFGPLTEAIQVKGAIALAMITCNGMHLDLARLDEVRTGLRQQANALVALLKAGHAWADVLNSDRTGQVLLTAKGQTPSLKQNRLRELLQDVAAEASCAGGPCIRIARTAKGQVSLRAEDWEELARYHPLVQTWLELVKVTKALQFFGSLTDPVIYPRYEPLVRTGRTSCTSPNVQNLPRDGGFREAFVPSPGHVFLVADYSFIELRTLAAECEARYGESRLADVIRAGVDPHCHTAAMFEGLALDEFMALKASKNPLERELYATLRQRAKVVNFGIPGGLGPATLVAYAFSTYGVALTLEEAGNFRQRLIEEVYPELGLYLAADDGMDVLARNLGTSVQACWKQFDWKGDRSGAVGGGIRNVVSGKTHRADGTPYKDRFLSGVWTGLIALNRNDEMAPLLARRDGSEELRSRLFTDGVTTLTGRIRGRVSYTAARNTPFQGLAADGAKLALWELTRSGYRVVAFVHDEVVIELPEDADHTEEAKVIETILNEAMAQVIGDVPVACEYALCRRWSKKAKAVHDENGRLVPCDIGVN